MAEAKLHRAGGAAGSTTGRIAECWPWALVLVLYVALTVLPSRIGETVIVQNLRLIGNDRAWLLGFFYGAMGSSGAPCSFREMLANIARLAFGVALVIAGVTMFPALIPTFYLVPALAIAGAGAFLGSLSGPRGLAKAVRHALDPMAALGKRIFRSAILVLGLVMMLGLVVAWGYQVLVHHDWTALAYGLCGLWGMVIARPAFLKAQSSLKA